MLIVSIHYLQSLSTKFNPFSQVHKFLSKQFKIFIVKIFNIDPQPERLNYKNKKIKDEASLYLKIFTLLNL